MCELAWYKDDDPNRAVAKTDDFDQIVQMLRAQGVRLEYWETDQNVAAGDSQDAVIAAYRSDIDRLIETEGYQSVDVVSITPDHPDKDAMRQKFLDEHTHSEDEVRFFVDGKGLFSLHIEDSVYEILCEKGELISVPANTPHWFDMGPNPSFVAIRLFNNPDGWVANFTGSDIAARFHRFEN